jgi:hypothetical protein
MEIAHWLNSSLNNVSAAGQRIYLGHESSSCHIPTFQEIQRILQPFRDSDRQITLVTPVLYEKEMGSICRLIEKTAIRYKKIEVVCNDWGLLQWLTESKVAEPIVGRLLVGQATDPRLAALDFPQRQQAYERSVYHADGTVANLRYKRPTKALMNHLRSCPLAIMNVLAFLQKMGVRRFEVSNCLQGIDVMPIPGWNVSLHLPIVPVAIARQCWENNGRKWRHYSFPVDLYQTDNMVFYYNDKIPESSDTTGIDRLVISEFKQ